MILLVISAILKGIIMDYYFGEEMRILNIVRIEIKDVQISF